MGGSPHTGRPNRNNGRNVTDIGNNSDIVKHLRKIFKNVAKILDLQ